MDTITNLNLIDEDVTDLDSKDLAALQNLFIVKYLPSLRERITESDDLEMRMYKGINNVIVPDATSAKNKAYKAMASVAAEKLVVDRISQDLSVLDFSGSDTASAERWRQRWLDHDSEIIEDILYRAAIGDGVSFLRVEADDTTTDGIKLSVYSSRYAEIWMNDPLNDIFSIHAIIRHEYIDPVTAKESEWFEILDNKYTHILQSNGADGDYVITDSYIHGFQNTPVFRFYYDINARGASYGEVKPLRPTFDRLNERIYHLQVVSGSSAFVQKFLEGLNVPNEIKNDPVKYNQIVQNVKLYLGSDEFLVATDNAKFGSVPASPIEPLLQSVKDGFTEISWQTGINLGLSSSTQIVNVGEETTKASLSPEGKKLDRPKKYFGNSWKNVYRFIDEYLGFGTTRNVEVVWAPHEDINITSIANYVSSLKGWGMPIEIAAEMLPLTPSVRARMLVHPVFVAAVAAQLRDFNEEGLAPVSESAEV